LANAFVKRLLENTFDRKHISANSLTLKLRLPMFEIWCEIF